MKKFVMLDTHLVPGTDWTIEGKILEKNDINYDIKECRTDDEVIEAAKEAEGIGVLAHYLGEKIINQLKNCKVIVRYGIGYDNLDVPAATKKGIVVCNLPDYCQEEVASHALALFLDICRKITLTDRSIRSGKWDGNIGYRINRISEMTIGLLGFGSIPRMFAKLVYGFNANIIAYDPYISESIFSSNGVKKVAFDELCAQSDAISIHTPLTPETKHIINKETLTKMKDGVFIVNTARGPIINFKDLLESINKGKVRAAGLDVFENEPISKDDYELLINCENIVATPHNAYNSVEAIVDQHKKVAYSAIKVINNGEIPYNAVNKKNLLGK